MLALLESGRIAWAIIAISGVEAILLLLYHRRTGRGLSARQLIPNILAGVALLLALIATASGWGAGAIGGCLVLAGLAHLADLFARFRR